MFFDIGANIGNWTLENVDKCDKIITIEASPTTFVRLLGNCKNAKTILLNYAVCNNNGEDITFYEASCDVLSTVNKDWLTKDTSRFCGQPYREIKCKTIGIDTLIDQYGLPDLIKIDVEGGEYLCISSLTRKVKLLCFEWASETNEITYKCIDHLVNLVYLQFYIQHGDNYVFRPQDSDFYDVSVLHANLLKYIPKQDWGMIWCK